MSLLGSATMEDVLLAWLEKTLGLHPLPNEFLYLYLLVVLLSILGCTRLGRVLSDAKSREPTFGESLKIAKVATTTLYRPIDPFELALIQEGRFREFPACLPDQPIFYPVSTLEYATLIAQKLTIADWGEGYVTRFQVRTDHLSRHEIHTADGRECLEYWIPAEELPEFNQNVVGQIEVVAEYHWPEKASGTVGTGNCGVVITFVDPRRKIAAMRAVREEISLGLAEAKNLVEGVPSEINSGLTKAEAEKLKERLERAGMMVEIRKR